MKTKKTGKLLFLCLILGENYGPDMNLQVPTLTGQKQCPATLNRKILN